MVSFSCEVCNDTIKKPKLDQHAGRCRGAYFTCIDCNTTFEGTSYRAHTSCVSEEQRYHKSVYKAPKGKGKNAQKQQQQQDTPPAAVPAPLAPAAPAADEKKRAREEDAPVQAHEAAALAPAPAPAAAVENGAKTDGGDEPAKKKKKKSKKGKGEVAAPTETNGAGAPGAALKENGAGNVTKLDAPTVKGFLAEAVTPLLVGGDVSLAEVREKVVAQAKAKGLKVDEVESALWAGLKVGGKKQKVRAEFA
ncbi:hypothetical protein JCM3770_003328 [Rhodotorula araucariae]